MSARLPLRADWRLAAIAALAAAAACAAWLFAPVLRGYFLSDDFVPLVLFRHWQEQGRLGAELGHTFAGGLDAGENHFYRPLSYLTFVLSYLASGMHARAWMALDVLVHVANGVMVGALGACLAEERPGARAIAAGAAGAALFLFFAPGAEVVAWVSGRFDAFATFFTLLACLGFARSRRALDAGWWIAIVAAACAFLSKESAAIVPFAIALLAFVRPAAERDASLPARAKAALVRSGPWIALAALYLAWRYAMFGSATTVYGGSHPVAAALSAAYWANVATAFPPWFSAQFRPAHRHAMLLALTALQLVLVAFARPGERRGRDALFAVAATTLLTIALVLPHVGRLPPSGIGGRLFYQTAAFYGVLSAIALRHARLARLLWGATLALAIVHAAFMHEALGRWSHAYGQMRALVAALDRYAAALPAGEYALVIVPADMRDVPFARNAQGGLMMPPTFERALSDRLLVQLDHEVPEIAPKIADGVVATLRRHSVFEYLGGRRVARSEYPTRAACWSESRRALVALDVPPAAAPREWGAGLERALRAAPCARPREDGVT